MTLFDEKKKQNKKFNDALPWNLNLYKFMLIYLLTEVLLF